MKRIEHVHRLARRQHGFVLVALCVVIARSALLEAQDEVTPQPQGPGVTELAAELRDKGWIVYSARPENSSWDLFLMRPDGSDRRNITNTPQFNEAGAKFSPDGKRILYYRMPKDVGVDNNKYGSYDLVVAEADGSSPVVLGSAYPWASWGPDSSQMAYLTPKGILIVDQATRKILRTLARKGIVQQLSWSPDGQWFVGTANGLGPFWTIGCMNAATGEVGAISEVDRYNCTPDWLPDSRHVIYARGIIPGIGGYAQLWVAEVGESKPRLLYAEEGRHIYGGATSPDGRYLLFTRSEKDLGAVDNSRTRIAVMRSQDAPVIVGGCVDLRQTHPDAKNGPVLDLSWGWEPHWTYAEIEGRN
jgi:Tol biopolymer transport system component